MPLPPAQEQGFVWWESLIRSGGALVMLVVVGVQRSAFTRPGLTTALVVLAASPWFLARWRPGIPWPVWTAVVLGSVTALLWRPESTDFAPFFLVYLAGTMATIRPQRISLPVAVVCCGPVVALEAAGRFSGAVIWVFAISVGWFFGFGFRSQLSLLEQLRSAQADLAGRAAADERRRIAGEIHDLVAHTLAVTVLHLTGARLALLEGETAEALDAVAEAERAGREAMAEIRGAVGLLGPSGGTDGALPAVTDVPVLVDSYTTAGLEVRLRYDLAGATVGGTTGLAAYRIVQEALANAARHAPGQPVDVEVVAESGQLRVAVENLLPADWTGSAAGGMGVPGTKERAGVAGGTADVGALGRWWRVAASMPLEAP